jgi:ferric-dicitrate binding protein FerR (iron transport regulator)
MTETQHAGLPSAWERILQRYAAPEQAQSLLHDAWRYLASDSPEHVPAGQEAETLKNLVYAYVEPARREAALSELAVAAPARSKASSNAAAALLALGSAAVAGIALWRIRR